MCWCFCAPSGVGGGTNSHEPQQGGSSGVYIVARMSPLPPPSLITPHVSHSCVSVHLVTTLMHHGSGLHFCSGHLDSPRKWQFTA
eukprot:5916210-Amphidinium_carterae.2